MVKDSIINLKISILTTYYFKGFKLLSGKVWSVFLVAGFFHLIISNSSVTAGITGRTSCAVLSLDFDRESPDNIFTLALLITNLFDKQKQESVAFAQH